MRRLLLLFSITALSISLGFSQIIEYDTTLTNQGIILTETIKRSDGSQTQNKTKPMTKEEFQGVVTNLQKTYIDIIEGLENQLVRRKIELMSLDALTKEK